MYPNDNYEARIFFIMDEYGCDWAEAEFILSVME